MNRLVARPFASVLLVSLLFAGCGGGDEADPPAPPPPPPPAGTLIGAAGGTVSGPAGASVVIPAGALSAETRINIEQTATGAPPLPSGFTVAGQSFALTPHGTTFAVPVTITLPFDPATVPAGVTPRLFKTKNAQTEWEEVAGATFGTSTVTAQISGFSIVDVVVPPFNVGQPFHNWKASLLLGDALVEEVLEEDGSVGVPLNLLFDFGGILDFPGGSPLPNTGVAFGDITASADGSLWALGSQAPAGNARLADATVGSMVTFKQTQGFHKRTADATLTIRFADAFLETIDRNSVLNRPCPAIHRLGLACDLINAEIWVDVQAFTAPFESETFNTFFRAAGGVQLVGQAGSWSSLAHTTPFSRVPVWTVEDFNFTIETLDGAEEALVRMQLRAPRVFQVDLSAVPVGSQFQIQSFALIKTYNRGVQGAEFPTGARATFRDPLSFNGATVTHTGLDPVEPLTEEPPPGTLVVPEPCLPGPGPDAQAGTIQFSAANYTQLEGMLDPVVVVTRVGGRKGAVTATLTSSNGSGVAGVDYTALNLSVFFADGDGEPRKLAIPVIPDTESSEDDYTVNLRLSEPGNCAGIGPQATTVVTVKDDDEPPPPPTFTLGGTVTGLAGTGLLLEDQQRVPMAAGNGPFTFPLGLQAGRPYEVTVNRQPVNPVQICTVVNGTGIMGTANVTNIQVNCVTPASSGALDPGFGGTGKVSTAFGGDDTGMVLQPDGKIIMVGGGSGFGADFGLARYKTDGTLDETFGAAGTGLVTTDLAGSNDEARAVALQSDGKIIVVGISRVGSSDDFAVVRYNTNGTLDTTFGTQGKTTTDFAGLRDRALAVAIQPDNRIVVVGDAIMASPGNADFGVARYTANGAPDTTFDGDGKLNTDIGGGVDIAQNVVLQGSQILVSGLLTLNGSPVLEHAGIARYNSNGALDAGFATAGKRTFAGQAVSEGLALQADGKIVLAGHLVSGGDRVFALMRLSAAGAPDNGFGSAGLATVALTSNDDFGRALAIHPDGRIFIAGQSSNQSNPDFGIACFTAGGVLDGSFDGDGKLSLDFFGSFDGAENIAVQADGKLVVSGFAGNAGRTNYGLARFSP